MIRIATRKSRLALWQAEHVAARLAEVGVATSLVPMVTEGDRLLDRRLATVGGKGLFIKELEHAMLEGRADIAVHSMKDVPAQLPEPFELAALLRAAAPQDALVSNRYASLAELPRGARVGTASLRRASQLLHRRPDLEIVALRGNVDTRLARLDEGALDAIVLACAGLERLGLTDRIRERLDPELCLPAIGQGIVGVECRANDAGVKSALSVLHDEPAAQRLAAERAVGRALLADCSAPVAAFAVHRPGGRLQLTARVLSLDGAQLLSATCEGPAERASDLGEQAARELLARGAGELLRAASQHAG